MSKGKVLRNYVSPIDQFLNAYDRAHPELSLSQKKEIAKYRRIYQLRDDPKQPDELIQLEDF